MNPSRRQLAFCLAGLTLTCLASGPVSAEPVMATPDGGIKITILKNNAIVRERYKADITSGQNVLLFPLVPREAEVSSLMIRDKFGALDLIEWSVPSYASGSELKADLSGRGVRIDFEKGEAFGRSALEVTVRSKIPGRRSFDLVYNVTGITWQASYDVLLRGDLSKVGQRLSMDTDGWIEIENSTARAFTNAVVTVIGTDSLEEQAATAKEPGILDLDDNSPLADLWRDQPPVPLTPHVYPVAEDVTLPASGSIMISHVSVKRKPVRRVLVLHAEEIPTDTFTRYAKPSQIITFQNEKDYGGNRSVPPGSALIHVGNQRSSINQKAWFKHTPAKGEIRIDMGKVDGVRSRRINRGRSNIPGGGYEQTFEVRIENKLDQVIQVVVDEEPPVFNLAWSLVRANQPHEAIGRRLIFNPTVEENSESVVQYTVRYSLPER